MPLDGATKIGCCWLGYSYCSESKLGFFSLKYVYIYIYIYLPTYIVLIVILV